MLAAVPALRWSLACNPHLEPEVISDLAHDADPETLRHLLARPESRRARLAPALARYRELLTAPTAEEADPNQEYDEHSLDRGLADALSAAGRSEPESAAVLVAQFAGLPLGMKAAQQMLTLDPGNAELAVRCRHDLRLAWLAGGHGQQVSDAVARTFLEPGPSDGYSSVAQMVRTTATILAQRPALNAQDTAGNSATTAAVTLLRMAADLAAAVPRTRWGRSRGLRDLLAVKQFPRVQLEVDSRPWILAALTLRTDLTPGQCELLRDAVCQPQVLEDLGELASTVAARVGGAVAGPSQDHPPLRIHQEGPRPPKAWAFDPLTYPVADLPAGAGPARLVAAVVVEGLADLNPDTRAQCWRSVVTLADTFTGTPAELVAVVRTLHGAEAES